MDVKWETPPESVGGRKSKPEENELAAKLREHPDQWARIYDFAGAEQPKAGSFASNVRAGKRLAFRTDPLNDNGVFEAVSRKIRGTDITAVYVRYATLNND